MQVRRKITWPKLRKNLWIWSAGHPLGVPILPDGSGAEFSEKIVSTAGFGHYPAMPPTIFRDYSLGAFLSLLLLCSCATKQSLSPPLPADVTMNDEAGRGGCLIVKLRLAGGEELPFMLDSGTTGTLIDKSWESKLGKPTGTVIYQSWGVKGTNNLYAMPKLYIGGTPLITGNEIVAYDFKKQSAGSSHAIMGVLGYDVLKHYCLQLDFAAGKIRFLDDERADRQTWATPSRSWR